MIVQENTPTKAVASVKGDLGALPPSPMYSSTPPVRPYFYRPYVPEPQFLVRRVPESTIRRFWKAFGLALLVWMLFATFTTSMNKFWGDEQTGQPTPADGVARSCIHADEWSEYFDDPPRTQYPHGAQVSFELPVDSEELFFLTRGYNAGAVKIVQSDIAKDTADVEIRAYFYEPAILEHVLVCHLTREKTAQGVGIFSPGPSRWRGQYDRLHFDVTISLPASSNDQPLWIRKFESNASLYRHEIGDLKESVHFGSLSIQTSNMQITAESVLADKGKFKSSNAPIRGTFNTSTSLEIITSNSPIDVTASLLNDDASEPTKLILKTSNGGITSQISLLSAYGTGGAFDVTTHTSNAHIYLRHEASPVDSILNLSAKTSNAPASVKLHSAFEGNFTLDTSLLMPAVFRNENAKDPSGKERRRILEQTRRGRTHLDGKVYWQPRGEGATESKVVVKTSNSPIKLYV